MGEPTVSILGVDVNQLTAEQALTAIDHGADRGTCQMLAYVNAHTLNLAVRDQDLRGALNRSALVLNDGFGVGLAARMRGERFPENLNGSDFTVKLLELAAANGWRVFLLGGEPGVAETAAERLTERIDGLHIAGTCHGFTDESDDLLAQRVRDAGAAMLIVAFGSPRQEIWIDRNLAAAGARIGVGVGAFLDFSAGKVVRAPRWMNVLGIEWCFRLAQEPRRLWRRYILGNPIFLLRAWRDRHRSPLAQPSFRGEPEDDIQSPAIRYEGVTHQSFADSPR
ncbi:MAG TPA: WecB/TagA/CpsF family glycosyltransferase [Solirubrobacteraceae bacterium]|nr:WecB/TagA/CpsF family glycosyltransferase [Solirubrobacteraceae bacterium]